MRISERVYLTASGRAGCSLSHPSDCNAYAVDCCGPLLLIDSGVGVQTRDLWSQLVADGADPAKLHALLLTHGHLDHSGGASEIHAQSGVPVWASSETADALELADEEAISLGEAKRAGIYDESFCFRSCPVARRLEGEERLSVGDATVRVIRTPGHSRDMISYLFETPDGVLAFTGDTVFHGGRVLISTMWDCHPPDYAASLRKLAACRIDGFYPGHSIWSVRDGSEQISLTIPYLDKGLLPPNLL
jgi:hydroxyacylglutathione hydrolase